MAQAFQTNAFQNDAFEIGAPVIPGVGPAGAATFVLDLENGASITYSWHTDVEPLKSMGGLEQRVSLGDAPAQHYDVTAFMLDADERTVRSALIVAAATGQAFLLGLPFEELSLSADATGATENVFSTALSDWANNPGQRVMSISPDGTAAAGVVQSATATTIVLDSAPGAAGKRGGRIMPTMAVYLDPQQVLRRHPVNVTHFDIKARAALFGFAGVDQMGVGATVTTYDSYPLYDRKIDVDDTAGNSLMTLGAILDAGGLPLAVGNATVVDLSRSIKMTSSAIADWQWFKRFIYTVAGRFAAFLLPSWQPDLVYDSIPGAAQIKVKSASTVGAGNYLTYFNNSLAQKRLQLLKTDGTIQYVTVTAAGDNGDGTLTLNLNASVTATTSMISFLEICRLEHDDVTVNWSGWIFSVELVARVVQQ